MSKSTAFSRQYKKSYFTVDKTEAFSKVYLQLSDSNENDDLHSDVRDTPNTLNSRTYNDIELVSKALQIIKQEKSGVNTVEINKCLSLDVGNTKNKFNCIKKLLYEGKTNKNKRPYFYMKVYSKEKLPYKHKYKNNHGFADLTKSSRDVERSFRTFFDFSDDYLDINDLLRNNNEVNEDKSVKTENMNNVFELMPAENPNNYFRMLSFSSDYLDTDDLRFGTKMADSNNNTQVFKLIPTNNVVNPRNYSYYIDTKRTNPKLTEEKPKEMRNGETKKKLYVFKLIPSTNLRRFRNSAENDFKKKEILRTVSVESDSSDSSDDSASKDKVEASKGDERKGKSIDKKPQRFHVIDKSVKEESSEEDTSNESEIPIQRPMEIPKKEKKVYYMQGSNRIFKIRNGRRRLPHFLPKRYHWSEEDMKNLENYWFNGPQGKYWGAYKTPY